MIESDLPSSRTPSAGVLSSWQRRLGATLSLGMVAGLFRVLLAGVASAAADTESATFVYTGSLQTFVVPAGINSLHITATGGDGDASPAWAPAVAVGPGSTITVTVPVGRAAETWPSSRTRRRVETSYLAAYGRCSRPT